MGIIIVPFLFITLIAFIVAIIFLYKPLVKKEIKPKNFLLGTSITIAIYAMIFLNYKSSENAYALGTFFMFPFFMILIPFVLGMILKIINQPITQAISNSILISVIVSGVFMVVLYKYTFGIIEYLGLIKHY
ncbi:hypothetical protein ACFS5J_05035 [Flavobacterium chuncheonense]|uniref:Uncharacterized protein n=1 Tax=Flavobacterium chuncheonense TaxID=2026653 RepID=A0ABW5YKA5_9FLAO